MPTWKKVVVSGSAISQLTNDANYLATLGDSVVSSSAQIGTDISGSFISASTVFETRIAAQEAFSSSLDAEFLSESELIPLNTETGSVKTRLNTIEAATSSYATKLGLGIVSASAEGDAQGQIKLNGVNVDVAGTQTDDSPQFAGVNIGHASDTTISRVAAGQVAVEGNNLLRATGDGILSSSAQIADNVSGSLGVNATLIRSLTAAEISGSLSAAAIVDLGANIVSSSNQVFAGSGLVSASAEGDAQGQIKLNGINVNVNGMQTDDNVQFADATITGNLTVSGTTTTVNSETLNIDDNIIALNGNGAALGGIAVNDGPATGSLLWDGTNDRWVAGATGSESVLLTTANLSGQYADIVSASSIASSEQGAAALTTNGVAQTAIDLGVKTDDSPQFAGVNVGHASDTTITRVGAGQVAVEGNNLLRANVDNVVSASAQIATDISGSFVSASTALGARIDNISTSFEIAGDTGTANNIDSDETFSIVGDNSISTTVTANTITISIADDVVSGSSIASGNQGEVALTTNGVAAAAIDLGLQTDDSPQFAGVNVGHASDSTITRTGAGQIAVEGNNLLRADVDNVMSGSAQTVENLVNQDVNLGTGDITGVSGSFDYVGDKDTILTGSFRGDGSALTGITSVSEGAIQNLGIGIVSSSQGIVDFGAGIVSSSATGDAQGQIKINGVNVDVNGMQTNDNVQFADATITGNLTVTGTTTTVNSETLNIDDNIIALNGNGAALGGIAVNDGPATGSLLWDGTNDRWVAGATGSESAVLTALGYGILSGSAEGDAQGQVKLNGVNVDANGVATGDSPQFAGVNVGHASDSTITRVGAGQIAIEGNNLLRANVDNVLSGSAQIAADISGSFVSASDALGTRIDNISTTFEIAGDSGTANNIDSTETFSILGDNSISTAVTENTITISIANDVVSGSGQLAADISGSGNVRFEALNTETGSLQAAITALGTESGSVKTRLNTIEAATSSYATKLGLGIVSASVLSNVNQGTLRLATNGVNTDVDLGLQAADSPTFADLTLTGNLTVTGDRIEQQVTNLAVEDQFITINSGASAQDAGIFFEGQGASLGWDESENRFALDFTGGAADQTTIAADAYIAAVATDIADSNYQKDGNLFVSASGDAFIYVTN